MKTVIRCPSCDKYLEIEVLGIAGPESDCNEALEPNSGPTKPNLCHTSGDSTTKCVDSAKTWPKRTFVDKDGARVTIYGPEKENPGS